MNPIEIIYGKVDNISQFVHPKYKRHFNLLSDNDQVELANRCLDAIYGSGLCQVVVSETGTSPLIYLCEQLAIKRGLAIDWYKFKVPREPNGSIYPLIEYHLTDAEKNETISTPRLEKAIKLFNLEYETGIRISEHSTRIELLKAVCSYALDFNANNPDFNQILDDSENYGPNTIQKIVSILLKDTVLGKTFSKPFLFFDEYINSGTTIKSANFHFKLFTENPSFKLGTYFIYQNDSKKFEKIAFSLYDLDSELECFNVGAYPFENRIDLIGYYFFINKNTYKKITIDSIFSKFKDVPSNNAESVVCDIKYAIKKNDLLRKLKEHAELLQVKNYLDDDHLIRQFFIMFEDELYGKNVYYEFLLQLAEMYGPIWSPMPKEIHFDFWNAFEKINYEMKHIPEFDELKKSYIVCRPNILSTAAKMCITRRNIWVLSVNKLMEDKNCY